MIFIDVITKRHFTIWGRLKCGYILINNNELDLNAKGGILL